MKQNERWALAMFILALAGLTTTHSLLWLVFYLSIVGVTFTLFVWGNE